MKYIRKLHVNKLAKKYDLFCVNDLEINVKCERNIASTLKP